MLDHACRCPRTAEGESCTPCGELDVITQEILEAERHLANLNAKRVQICARINQVHDPLTTKLPAEVISKIFTTFLPFNVDRDYGIRSNRQRNKYAKTERITPLLLAAVCTTWRALAWSTPQLWTSISVDISYVNDSVVDILRDWLRRSGELPLYILIHSDPVRDYHSCRHRDRISDLFAPYSPRWFYLELDMHPTLFPSIYSNISKALILKTLSIESFSFGTGLDLAMIPSLRNVAMSILDIHRLLNLNWKNLTSIQGGLRTVDILFELLSNATSLTHCTFYLMDGNGALTTRNSVLQHDHLVYLNIRTWTEPTDIALSLLKFPALKHLVVPKQTKIVADLLGRSGCTLKTLDTITSDDSEYGQYLIPFLEKIPSLETLGLIESYTSSLYSSMDPLIARLSDPAITGKQETEFLPSLKSLYIIYLKISWARILGLLLAYPQSNCATTTTAQFPDDSKKRPHVRPLNALHIQLPKIDDELIDPNIAQKLQYAIEDSSVEVTVADSAVKPIPLTEFLRKFLSPLATVEM